MTEPVPSEKKIKAKRATGVQAAVLQYMDKHSNQTLYLNDIANDISYPAKIVQNAITALRYSNKSGAQERLEIVVRGQAYMWHSGKVEDGKVELDDLYVKVFVDEVSGAILVRGEDNKLYKLVGPL